MEGYANRESVLKLNHELRKERKTRALPDESGHVAFQLPVADYWYWTIKYPDLAAKDSGIARKAWQRFLNSDEGAKYKINPHEGKRAPYTKGVICR